MANLGGIHEKFQQDRVELSTRDGTTTSYFGLPRWDPDDFKGKSVMGGGTAVTSSICQEDFLVKFAIAAHTETTTTLCRLPFAAEILDAWLILPVGTGANAETFQLIDQGAAGAGTDAMTDAKSFASVAADTITRITTIDETEAVMAAGDYLGLKTLSTDNAIVAFALYVRIARV